MRSWVRISKEIKHITGIWKPERLIYRIIVYSAYLKKIRIDEDVWWNCSVSLVITNLENGEISGYLEIGGIKIE